MFMNSVCGYHQPSVWDSGGWEGCRLHRRTVHHQPRNGGGSVEGLQWPRVLHLELSSPGPQSQVGSKMEWIVGLSSVIWVYLNMYMAVFLQLHSKLKGAIFLESLKELWWHILLFLSLKNNVVAKLQTCYAIDDEKLQFIWLCIKHVLLLNTSRNLGTSYELLRDWSTFSNTSSSVTWLNFDLEHKDRVKTELKVTNGALNSVTQETDGFVVDLSPPELEHLWDGLGSSDIMYQVWSPHS